MPRISDNIADSAIYMYSSEKAAKDGQEAGGSGFLASVPSIPGMVHLYAVTNRHLVDGSKDGTFWTLRLTRKSGGIDCIVTQKDNWFLHDDGDDVAILPIDVGDGIKWWAVESDKFLDREGVGAFGFGYGDEVFMVGRLISHSGFQKNTPVARFGTIALNADPEEPIKLKGRTQEAFLIECRSISGFSGSPVFVMTDRVLTGDRLQRVMDWEQKRYPQVEAPATGATFTEVARDGRVGPFLLGIDFGHIQSKAWVYKGKRQTDYEVQANTGIAGVIPAWKVMDLLMTPSLVEDRAKEDAELARACSH